MLKNDTPVINVWIHGTFPQDFISKDLHNSTPFNYIVNKYYCPPGFNRVIDLPERYHYCLLARKAMAIDLQMFPADSFYLFGWSGKLDAAEREKGGTELYDALKKLIAEKYQGSCPFIRLVTHSHGGNVALAMAKHVDGIPAFYVDELILLACPVHKATVLNTRSALFKQIFSIHSHADMIQVLDPQGLPDLVDTLKNIFTNFSLDEIKKIFKASEQETFFSGRYFPPQQNLKNIRLQINGRDVFHMEYILSKFFLQLPTIINVLEEKENASKLVATEKGDWLLNIVTK